MTSRQVDQFARALERGEPLDITGEDGTAAIEMVEAAIRSARTNEAVAIPLEREQLEDAAGETPAPRRLAPHPLRPARFGPRIRRRGRTGGLPAAGPSASQLVTRYAGSAAADRPARIDAG